MQYFSVIDFNNKNKKELNKNLYYKMSACSVFNNQDAIDKDSEFQILCENQEKDYLKKFMFAKNNIKFKSIDHIIDVRLPECLKSKKISAYTNYQNDKFCFFSNHLFINNFSKIKNSQSDFTVLCIDKNAKYSPYYKIGLNLLNFVDCQIPELKNFTIENLNFEIYNTSLLVNRNTDLFNFYMQSFSKIISVSTKIDFYIRKLPYLKRIMYSKAVSLVLENLLFSKIIYENNLKIDTICESLNNISFLKNKEIDANLLKNSANILNNYNNIENKYNDIVNEQFISVEDFINNFSSNKYTINNVSWGNEVLENFEREKNSKGGCSSCKLKRLVSKYKQIRFYKFEKE